jgi:23S rRNA pseudouridine2605 synthase
VATCQYGAARLTLRQGLLAGIRAHAYIAPMSNPEEPRKERIAKIMARAGLCSRREAERWIAAGRVRLNGKLLDTPAVTVGESDEVIVDGKPLPGRERTRLWRYHKPAGLVTSHSDEQGRLTVFDKMPADMPRVVSVGRLDLTSEGLLLMTNDGELARKLELPSTGWNRRYRVRVYGNVEEKRLQSLTRGITVDGVRYGPIKAVIDNEEEKRKANTWLLVTLSEGKNREIRKVLAHLGLDVNRLIRTAYGPFQLGKLQRGGIEEVKGKVIREQVAGVLK